MKLEILLITLFALQLLAIASALTIKNIDIPEQVAPGKEFSLEIKMENNLEDDIEDVQIALDLANLPIAPVKTSEAYFDVIETDDSEMADFSLKIFPDAEAGTYKIPIKISYEVEGNKEITRTSYASIIINSKPEIQANTNSFLLQGKKNKIEISLTNKGLAKAKFLEIELLESSYKILSQKKVYIGDLNSDDFDSASFEVYTDKTGLLSMPVLIRYNDMANKQYTDTESISIQAYSSKEAAKIGLSKNSKFGFYLIIFVGLIIIYLIYRKIKKRRKNNA